MWDDPAIGRVRQAPTAYALRGIYFNRDWFTTPAECLTAAYARGLPLQVCQ
jgi:hypothetical protein